MALLVAQRDRMVKGGHSLALSIKRADSILVAGVVPGGQVGGAGGAAAQSIVSCLLPLDVGRILLVGALFEDLEARKDRLVIVSESGCRAAIFISVRRAIE